jgi:hypothetical protein
MADLAADSIGGCEALLRWRHPVRGLLHRESLSMPLKRRMLFNPPSVEM